MKNNGNHQNRGNPEIGCSFRSTARVWPFAPPPGAWKWRVRSPPGADALTFLGAQGGPRDVQRAYGPALAGTGHPECSSGKTRARSFSLLRGLTPRIRLR
jgi:hypothetical protein